VPGQGQVRTLPGTKLQAAVAGAVVAFEADHIGSSVEESWSVLVCGRAEEITGGDGRAELEKIVPDSWALDGGADHLVRIPATVITGITGRRLHPSSPAPESTGREG
jgi:hypothetical protein